MDLIEYFRDHLASGEINESMSQMVRESFQKQLKVDSRPAGYFYLTELVNPMQAFWTRMKPSTTRSTELAKKLAAGRSLQQIAGIWFRLLPDFVIEESVIDGVWVGIPGVIGRIDYRVGKSIFELKSKPEQVLDVETILDQFPQDLEQLAFYAALLPMEIEDHYLVFMTNKSPYFLTVFNIKLKNIGAIRNLLKQRKRSLLTALETGDPKYLGRCRYFESGCEFREAHICDCDTREEIRTDILKKEIVITRDEVMEKNLEKARKASKAFSMEVFSPWDLLYPRKWFMRTVKGIESPPLASDKQANRAALSRAIFDTIQLRPNRNELRDLKKSTLEAPVRIPTWWIKMRSSKGSVPTGELIPFIAKVSGGMPRTLGWLPEVYFAELGIFCGLLGKSRGAIFVIYPDADFEILAYIINFRDYYEFSKVINKLIEDMFASKESELVNGLPKCPDYMCNGCIYAPSCGIEE